MDARRALRLGVRTLVALTSVLALAVAGLAWSLQQQLDTAVTSRAAIPDAAPTPPGQAYNALLVGLDARTDSAGNPLPPELFNALHVGPDAGQLDTDTIILLHVPADPNQPAEAISIPRDSYVPIAGGRGMHKINSAYEAGLKSAEDTLTAQGITGPELDRRGREAGRATLVATVEQLTGVQIDHFAEINFVGFVQLTEALGGVPVCLNKPVHDSYSGIDLPAGPQTVNGATALAFVRQRHGLQDGDLDRIARQQAFAAGLADRLISTGTLTNPVRLAQLVAVVNRNVVLDDGWNVEQALAQFAGLQGNDLRFLTIPTGRPDLRTPYDGIAIQIDQAAVRAFVRSVIAGHESRTPISTGPSGSGPSGSGLSAEGAPTGPSGGSRRTPATTPPESITADGIHCVN
ncbi:LCP family protein [Pseudonocardia alaniniphila]|uniref:LCP family protein n=1 Tax=Pseudonocardia alaniniphila TaxID=75291 RepID=A0ABS9TPG9_9PSEU|nr:LCP family protein [Pseudonocardia alaniniphila]MCH6170448.1 LCP family protein [Pseudonocardia alaniniphila]